MKRTSFWPPSMVYTSVIITHKLRITIFHRFNLGGQLLSFTALVPGGWFHESWAHVVNHRDSSIYLRSKPMPNFWEAILWRKRLAECAKQSMKMTPGRLFVLKQGRASFKFIIQMVTVLKQLRWIEIDLQSKLLFLLVPKMRQVNLVSFRKRAGNFKLASTWTNFQKWLTVPQP